MAIKRLMRQTRTILAVPCIDVAGVTYLISGTVALPILTPLAAPTAASLNTWQSVITANAVNASIGGNISQAVLDSAKLGLGASATDSTLTITSVGNEVTPTLTKVNATVEIFRDQDPLGNGVFNLAWQLLRTADIRYILVDRIQGGKKSTSPFAVGDVVSLYVVKTDNGLDIIGDGKFTTMTQNFIPTGFVNPNYTLVA